MANLWDELMKLRGTEVPMRDLHDAVDELPGTRVVPIGQVVVEGKKRRQAVQIVRRGFRPVILFATAAVMMILATPAAAEDYYWHSFNRDPRPPVSTVADLEVDDETVAPACLPANEECEDPQAPEQLAEVEQ